MASEIIVAALSLLGTLGGSLSGILVSNRLTNYRLEQLERRVQTHNSLIERTYKLEGEVVEIQHDIRDIKAQKG